MAFESDWTSPMFNFIPSQLLLLYYLFVPSGPCDLAKGCTNNAACTGNFDGSITCKCRTADECPSDGDGVCGSDGRNYTNKCQLDVMACANSKEIQVQHTGPCGRVFRIVISLHFWCILIS